MAHKKFGPSGRWKCAARSRGSSHWSSTCFSMLMSHLVLTSVRPKPRLCGPLFDEWIVPIVQFGEE